MSTKQRVELELITIELLTQEIETPRTFQERMYLQARILETAADKAGVDLMDAVDVIAPLFAVKYPH